MSDNPGETYGVGYKKPPKATRYQKGSSGNPNGRPKKLDAPLDTRSLLQAIENEPILFALENGKRKWMTKIEARFHQLFQMAISGDLKAAKNLVTMAKDYLIPEENAEQQTEFVLASEAILRDGEKLEKLGQLNTPVWRDE